MQSVLGFGADGTPFINSLAEVGPRIIATKTWKPLSKIMKFESCITHPHKDGIQKGGLDVK